MLNTSLIQAASTGNADRLISATNWLRFGELGHTLPPAIVIAFDQDEYSSSAFARTGISFPPHICRSAKARQVEYLVGRLAAREAMALLGIAAHALGTGSLREPLWPQGVIGSITHTDRLAAAVAIPSSMADGIGIDIEPVLASDEAADIRDTILTADEQKLLTSTVAPGDQNTILSIVFSAKESFFKATSSHVGRYFDFSAIKVSGLDVSRGHLAFKVSEALSPAVRVGQRFDVRFGMIDLQTVFTYFTWRDGFDDPLQISADRKSVRQRF